MTVLILSDADVRSVLDMPSCITAMEEVLAELARGGLHNPLRFVTRPPADTFMGFMPAYRGGRSPLYSLKEVVIAPANHARGLDAHQGAVLLHDGVTGVLTAVLNASAITEIRTAAVSAVATGLLSRPSTPGATQRVAIIGSGVQARSHIDAMRCVSPGADVVIWSRNGDHARRLADASGCSAAPSIEEAFEGADVVCTTTSSRDPIVSRSMLRPGMHLNAVGSSIPAARELDGEAVAACSLFVDRRESTVNESGDYLDAVRDAGIGPDHIRAELGEILVGTHPGRASADQITLFKSLGIAVEDLAAAELCVSRARACGVGTEVDL